MFNENPSLHSPNSSHTTCNFCGKYGHTEAVCFHKVGFPSGNVKTSKFSFTRKVCTFCDENQIKEAFINGGRGHPPSHLKFFLLVFSKLKEDIK